MGKVRKRLLKVNELIDILKTLPQDAIVVKQEGVDFWNVTEAFTIRDGGQDKVLIQ